MLNSTMLDQVWPTLPTQLRDELISQGIRQLKDEPQEYESFATAVAAVTKARPQSVKAQWRVGNLFGTKLAIAREPVAAAGFLAMTFMRVRQSELSALYAALDVEHKDLEVSERSSTTAPPAEAKFSAVLNAEVPGVPAAVVQCMIAVIADTGIDSWRQAAKAALTARLTKR